MTQDTQLTRKKRLTPLMEQYDQIKKRYPEALLLFQVGDFFELFFDDAHKAAECLSITLTKRGVDSDGNPIPLCGVPCHAVKPHLVKLVRAGFHVALCEQLEPPRPGSIVKRAVTQVLTPGTLTDTAFLEERVASYVAFFFPATDAWALTFVEILTGHILITSFGASEFHLMAELSRFMPDEVVVPDISCGTQWSPVIKRAGYRVTVVPWEPFALPNGGDGGIRPHAEEAFSWVQNRFGHGTQYADFLRVITNEPTGPISSLLCLMHRYLAETDKRALDGLSQLSVYYTDEFMLLDAATQRNLELTAPQHGTEKKGTLLFVLDVTVTSMGSRLMRKWMQRPLLNKNMLKARLDTVEVLIKEFVFTDHVRNILKRFPDLERMVGRMALGRAQIEDYRALRTTLAVLAELRTMLNTQSGGLLGRMYSRLEDFAVCQALLADSIADEGDMLISAGYDAELDRLRQLVTDSSRYILELEKKEAEATEIRSLKIKYTGAHGYAIEVTKLHLHRVPDRYQLVQALVNRSRFATDELKQREYDCKRAEADYQLRQELVFTRIQQAVLERLPGLRRAAHVVSVLDVLVSFARRAREYHYVRPTFDDTPGVLEISEGRHPVLEMLHKEPVIPNTVQLGPHNRTWIITGPNMGGKSTVLRQTALITIMAHMGSYVPAEKAHMSIVDRIFTRIGAADNVVAGASTFMVEMTETSTICAQATCQSLVILDEVGRGTSTLDGRALAQAVVEYLHETVRPLCLFATHYSEVAEDCERIEGIGTRTMASKQTANGIIFLHKLEPGIAQGSFGIEVAKQAQIPDAIIERAQQLVQQFTHE